MMAQVNSVTILCGYAAVSYPHCATRRKGLLQEDGWSVCCPPATASGTYGSQFKASVSSGAGLGGRGSTFFGDGRLTVTALQNDEKSRRRKRGQKDGRGLSAVCMAVDYYTTLGVPKSASKQDIKSAYRRLARQYHPDVNKAAGAEEKFKEISNAYEILSDDEKRPLYDMYGEAGIRGAAGGGGAAGAYTTTNPFDLFESFFGGAAGGFSTGSRRRSGPQQGDDCRYEMTLEFTEAVFGTEKEFEAQHLETCRTCSGSGARPGTQRKKCDTCGGMGQVMRTQQTPFGTFSQVSTCAACAGEGTVIMDYCRKCGGEGRVRVKKSLKVKVPAGVTTGSTLRVRGEGDAGPRGGPSGDLYVFLNVLENPSIQREGIDLYSKITVEFTEAILGTVVQVKTVEGTRDLAVPPGTQPGDTLVLSKMGVPKLNKPSVRGDHFFTVKVVIPTKISEAERELVQELAEMRKRGLKATAGRRFASRGRAESAGGASTSGSAGREGEEEGEGVWDSVKNAAGQDGESSGSVSGSVSPESSRSPPPGSPRLPPTGVQLALVFVGSLVLGALLAPLLSKILGRLLIWLKSSPPRPS